MRRPPGLDAFEFERCRRQDVAGTGLLGERSLQAVTATGLWLVRAGSGSVLRAGR